VSQAGRPENDGKGAALIMLVDDYVDNREVYAHYLRFKGYRVEEAEDGLQALEKAQRLRPDLIIMDLALPGLDGWEATRRLKAAEKTRAIPVIALTGHALEGQAERARAAGCDDFVTKPCEPIQLEARIRTLLQRAAGTGRAARRRRG
jgi:two-component system, cell cycle response regulator DivK